MKRFNGSQLLLAAIIIALALLGVRYFLSVRHSMEPAIAGTWNNIEAGRYVTGLLKHYGDNAAFGFDQEPFSSEPLRHYIYDYFPLKYPDGEHHLVVAYTKPEPFDCRSCAPKLSLMEFVPVADGWKPGVSSIGKIAAGSWGSPPYSVGTMELGPGKFGVVVENSGDQRGAWESSLDIYTALDGDYRKVATIVTERHGYQYKARGLATGSWQMGTLPQTSAGYYDILVKRTNNTSETPAAADPTDNQRYRFDGERYSPVS